MSSEIKSSEPELRFGGWFDRLFFGLLFPIGLSFFSYFGYVTAYTAGVFSPATFFNQYDKGIYKYRVLGKWAFLGTHTILQRASNALGVHMFALRFIPFIDKDGDSLFYLSYFILNTFFLLLTCLALISLFRRDLFALTDSEKRARVALLTLLIVFSEFVVVPYDTLSYFLLVLGMSFTIRYFTERRSVRLFLCLAIILVLATLTRETATLTISFFAVVALWSGTVERNKLAMLIAIFLAVYLGLRLAFGFNHGAYDGFGILFTPPLKNILGLSLAIAGLSLFVRNKSEIHLALQILLFSLPYIAGVMLFGLWREVRLFAPLFLVIAVGIPLRRETPRENNA